MNTQKENNLFLEFSKIVDNEMYYDIIKKYILSSDQSFYNYMNDYCTYEHVNAYAELRESLINNWVLPLSKIEELEKLVDKYGYVQQQDDNKMYILNLLDKLEEIKENLKTKEIKKFDEKGRLIFYNRNDIKLIFQYDEQGNLIEFYDSMLEIKINVEQENNSILVHTTTEQDRATTKIINNIF